MPNAVPAGGGALPPAKTIFLAVTPAMRLRIATTIENLLAFLDEIDGDADLEPTNGWSSGYHPGSQLNIALDTGHPDEVEEVSEDEGADINNEPQDTDELEADEGEYDAGGFIWGGNEEARP